MKNDLHIAEIQDAIERGDFVTTLCGEFIQCRTIQPLAENEWVPYHLQGDLVFLAAATVGYRNMRRER